MSMAANSNMNFYHQRGHGVLPPSFYNQHVVNFQSGAVNSNNLSGSSSSMFSGFGNYGDLIIEPLPGLKHDTGLAVDWSFNEQATLNDGLAKFADEPGMMKYVKIARLLPEKTVRDVALRCRWMAKKENVKRRKIEDSYAAKKFQNRKVVNLWRCCFYVLYFCDTQGKMADSSLKSNMHSLPPVNSASYSFLLHSANHNNQYSYEVPAVDGATQLLLDENVQILNQISANLSNYKLHDNVELFSRTSNNIMAILDSMSQTPGVMSRMTPLPVSINKDVMNSILPITSQDRISELASSVIPRCANEFYTSIKAPIYGTPSGISLKKEQDDDTVL